MRAPVLTFKRARALRRDMTLPEVILWEHLRGGRLGGLRFRRQHPIGPYILDFYCSQARLAVEVEGWVHDSPEQALHDERRQAWLARRSIRMLRFSAKEVLKDEELEGVLLMIEQGAARSSPAQRGRGPPKAVEGADRRARRWSPPPPCFAWSPSPVASDGGGSSPLSRQPRPRLLEQRLGVASVADRRAAGAGVAEEQRRRVAGHRLHLRPRRLGPGPLHHQQRRVGLAADVASAGLLVFPVCSDMIRQHPSRPGSTFGRLALNVSFTLTCDTESNEHRTSGAYPCTILGHSPILFSMLRTGRDW
jgi:very-short-patch-repair endonuclease